MPDKIKLIRLLLLLKKYKEVYGFDYYMTGSYREGENITYSDIDFLLIGGNYPEELMKQTEGVAWISLTHIKEKDLKDINYKIKNCLRILDAYFRNQLGDLYIENRKVLDLHVASFYSLTKTYNELKSRGILKNGLLMDRKAIFRHFRLFDRYMFGLFNDDPFALFQKQVQTFTPKLKEKNYFVPVEDLGMYSNEIELALEKLVVEFDRVLERLKSNPFYYNLLEPKYIKNVQLILQKD